MLCLYPTEVNHCKLPLHVLQAACQTHGYIDMKLLSQKFLLRDPHQNKFTVTIINLGGHML